MLIKDVRNATKYETIHLHTPFASISVERLKSKRTNTNASCSPFRTGVGV